MEIKFKKPFNFEGQEYESITLDLDALTGGDIEEAQFLVTMDKKSSGGVPELNKAFCAQVAALASKKPVEFVRALPAKEYAKVTLEVQTFLLDGGS